jgi:hypothetical protein
VWSRAFAVLVVSCVVLALGGPAHAQRLVLRDARYDTWRPVPGGEAKPAPWAETGDITRVAVRHRPARVVVRIGFASVRRSGIYAQYAVRVQASGDPRRVREVVVEAGPQGWRGQARVFRGSGKLARGCDAGHRIDYADDFVVVRLERGCLGRPGRVRVNVDAYRANDRGVFFADSAHTDQAHSRAWSDWVKRTRR